MALTIDDNLIGGERTRHTARRVPGHPHAWDVSWLPGQLLDRNAAITAMILADVAAASDPRPGDRLWPHIEGWATAIGLTASGALARVAQPPGSPSAEHDGQLPAEPEAGR